MIAHILLALGLLGSPLQAQKWAEVHLENGNLFVYRLTDGNVQLVLQGARSWTVEWSPLAAAIAIATLRLKAGSLPPDTVSYRDSSSTGAVNLRCAPVGCWATITHAGRAGYWRPRPTFDALLLGKLANALEAARLGVGAFWIEDLR